MGSRPLRSGGVDGTLGAFKFIRRIAFPTTLEVISVFCTLVFLSTLIALPATRLSFSSIVLTTTLVLVVPVLVGEMVNTWVILRGDPVLDFRRLMGLEILSWLTLLPLLSLSTIVGVVLDTSLWADALLLSIALSLPLRSLSIFAISPLQSWRKALGVASVPAIVVSALSLTSSTVGLPTAPITISGFAVLVVGLTVSTLGVSMLIRGVERSGSPSVRDSPMDLFRAFLRHWLKKDSKPLEERLAGLGSQGEIETSILSFSNPQKRPKGCVVVSSFHPGPYRDLGSGGLPSTLKLSLESSVGGVALVPHGISNHEFNIISHEDITTFLTQARLHYPSDIAASNASLFIREEFEGAKASAQTFGNLALLTLTLAPDDMEDLPVEVLNIITADASHRGLTAVVIDAHNSLSGQTSITPEQARKLAQAAVKALTRVSTLSQHSFKVGTAADPLREFSLQDGIGPGGLSIIAVETGAQLAAYVTIDGNNLQSGFRELILNSLKEEGVDEAEVTTTDTHLVTGLVPSSLGYHPVGEGIDRQILLARIRKTLRRAVADMEEASTAFSTFKLDLRVLGSTAFSTITSFIGKTGGRIGRFLLRLELAAFLSALAILSVL
jgi:predicted neutral ceramidase superfamily lipid hydrolase